MTEYISQATLEVNGKQIDDFKSVEEDERELRKKIKLATKQGFVKTTQQPGVKVEYVVPQAGEFDWDSVKNGRLTIEYENGKRVTYTGVYVLKVGSAKIDGDNETTKNIELGATRRVEE